MRNVARFGCLALRFANRRSMLPSDIRGEQCDSWRRVASDRTPSASGPYCRRCVDQRQAQKRSGQDSHRCLLRLCRGVDGWLAEGGLSDFRSRSGGRPKLAHRALQIASAITKRDTPLPDRVIAVSTALYGEALKVGQPVNFARVVQLCVEYRVARGKTGATI